MLLLEKEGVPLCFPIIKRPCFERQIRKTRRNTNVVRWSVKILHSELFPGSSAVLVLFTEWVLYKQVLQMVMEWCFLLLVLVEIVQVSLFLHFKRIIPALRHLRRVGVAPNAFMSECMVVWPEYALLGQAKVLDDPD